MKKLYNQLDKRILMQRMQESTEPRVTLSFYQYANILNPNFFRDYLFYNWDQLGVLGRTYVAKEGINGQISVPEKHFEQFQEQLYSIRFLNGIRLNIAVEDDGKSFYKLKVKVRQKIVADGLNDDSFDVTKRGKHLDAKEFNELTDDPNTILIDMRNHYESEVGHFEGALTPDADTFREEIKMVEEILDGQEDKNIVMYCTGGIRCEKASAWFKHQGYENVHQLNGGIIEYARQVKEQGLRNKYIGKNFVFDERRAERISDDIIAHCHQCGNPCDDHTNCANPGCNLLFIQCKECKDKLDACCTPECKEVISWPEEKQAEWRKENTISNKVYRKGRLDKLRTQGVYFASGQ